MVAQCMKCAKCNHLESGPFAGEPFVAFRIAIHLPIVYNELCIALVSALLSVIAWNARADVFVSLKGCEQAQAAVVHDPYHNAEFRPLQIET
jgi:hypothetical protein